MTFVPDSATVTTSTIVSKSGNPGYRFGSPLLLEKCGASGSTQACTSFTDATGAGAGARHDLPGISSLGECVYGSSSAVTSYLATDGVGVNFGEDTVLGCSLSFTAAELATFCAAGTSIALLRQKICYSDEYTRKISKTCESKSRSGHAYIFCLRAAGEEGRDAPPDGFLDKQKQRKKIKVSV